MGEKKSESWKMFNEISSTYDRVNRILSLGQDVRWRKKVAMHLPLQPHLQVLDLATGTGDQLGAITRAGLSIRKMVGLDLSKEMLAIAHKKWPQIEFLHGDAMHIPFEPSSFDAITFSFGIRNVETPLQSLKEMHRVLKSDGRALILEFSTPSHWIRPFFLFYLRKILPRLGALLSGHKEAYRYLNRTIESFPSGDAFLALMKEAGFTKTYRVPMNFGGVTLYVGEK
ncbi:MAG: bifunctional demethylmenaquinone methyltransferase/2-methoxy-6-polyprenyl-1,4-benzoquinol methylase UbiE [Verrucomicrobiota bacterium]|nr:bifunctional demethylmenaquinone methyltransferase/2-methoxy-6-polyprenyl-1,4-benzoquinol methylase UbiE [Verrucomicrobiota bacterium]